MRKTIVASQWKFPFFYLPSQLKIISNKLHILIRGINFETRTSSLIEIAKADSYYQVQFSLFHFSRSVMSNSLWPHGLQHARLPCPLQSPRDGSNSCLLNQWCHPTTSSSVVPFSWCPQSFPASGSFPVSQLFASGGQSIAASASASVLPMNIQGWFPLGSTGWISWQSKGLSRIFSSTTIQKHLFMNSMKT